MADLTDLIELGLSSLFEWIEKSKTTRTIVRQLDADKTRYEVTTNAGYGFFIYCEEHRFAYWNGRSMRSTSPKSIFRVYCHCDENTPDVIRNRLSKVLDLPCLVSNFTSVDFKKKAAIKAYLDLILSEMKNEL
jgi:hypothetical protein